jgi:hypothetical protein
VQRLLADGKWIHSLFMSSSGYRVNTVETEWRTQTNPWSAVFTPHQWERE